MTFWESIYVVVSIAASGRMLTNSLEHAKLTGVGAIVPEQSLVNYLAFTFFWLAMSVFIYSLGLMKTRRHKEIRDWRWMYPTLLSVLFAASVFRHSQGKDPIQVWTAFVVVSLSLFLYRPLRALERRRGVVVAWMVVAGCVLLGLSAFWSIFSVCLNIVSPTINYSALPEKVRSGIVIGYIKMGILFALVLADIAMAIFITGRLSTLIFWQRHESFHVKRWSVKMWKSLANLVLLSVTSGYILWGQGLVLSFVLSLKGDIFGVVPYGIALGLHYLAYRRLKARAETESRGERGGRKPYTLLPPP